MYLTSRLSQGDAVANTLQRLKSPTSIVLIVVTVVALMCTSLLGGELCMRLWARSLLTTMLRCMVDDDATVSIAASPPVLVQFVEGHYTDVTIVTTGRQVGAAQGMTIAVDIKDFRVPGGRASAGTIGSLSATMVWTDDGMTRTARQTIPLLGGFVTGVTTDPSAGTIALAGLLGTVTVIPAVADGELRLRVESLTGLGLPLPREGLQSALNTFAQQMNTHFPMGLRVDGVRVTDAGVAAHFAARNISIPATWEKSCLPGQH